MGFCITLLIAGNETTTKLLGNAVYWLWRNPDQRRLVAAGLELGGLRELLGGLGSFEDDPRGDQPGDREAHAGLAPSLKPVTTQMSESS